MRMKRAGVETIGSAARLVKALADPVRLRLINLLAGHEVCVCNLHEALRLPQPTVSRHLAYLRKLGIVAARKDGLWVHYSLAEPETELHAALLNCVMPALADNPTMKADRARLSDFCC